MDLSNPWMILSGLVIGLAGLLMFNYGRKEQDLKAAGAGLALCIYPYFVTSLLVMWLVFALVGAGLWAWNKWG